ncbi:MAG: NERD domain-containing protein, partial [Firmicutes bacterium]|nr:NERD domain-containing protein [Bacillota bacterium]
HEKGIFVFESKNYSGTIYGEIDQLNWIQVLDNGSKNKFYNPIRQNKTHIKALAKYLDLPEEDFLSYVIFSERCTLKKVPPKTPQVVVLRRPEMLERLQLQIAYNKRKYDDETFGKIISKLREGTNKSEEEKQKHIEDIKTKCPFCGNELILRKGKYGEFWGCSAYPKCKFTRQNK